MILTKRIRLLVNLPDGEPKLDVYKIIVGWQQICSKAANIAMSHYFVQDRIQEFFYLTEEVHYKLLDQAVDKDGIFVTSRMNTVYSVLSKRFKGEIPMRIISALSMQLIKSFNADREKYLSGERSVRNYKNDMPVPIQPHCIRNLRRSERTNEFELQIFNLPFRTYLGKDKGDKKACLESILQNRALLKTSSLQLKGGKIYLLASYLHDPVINELHQQIAEVSLSFEVPLIVKINQRRYEIGSKDDFLYRRLAIQRTRNRLQLAVKYNNGGHGKKRKFQALQRFREKEKNYVHTRLHKYTSMLVQLCIKHQVGTIIANVIVEDTSGKDGVLENGKSSFLLRNWNYYSLIQKIQYKAEKNGIEVICE